MKKILLVCLLLCSTPLLAYNHDVIVKITNETDADCLLTNKTVLYEHIAEARPLPDEIFRGQTIEFKMDSEGSLRFGVRKDKIFLLTYHCAEDQQVRLFANISPFQDSVFPLPSIAITTSAIHMNVHTDSVSSYPLQVHWTLTKSLAAPIALTGR